MEADTLGYDSVWMPEHMVIPVRSAGSPHAGADHPPIPADVPVFDVFAYLGFLAGQTEHIHFGTQVYNIGLRHPFIVARAVATLDVVSNGRLEFGIGASWLQAEWEAVGLDFATRGSPGGRVHRGLPATLGRRGGGAPWRVLRLRTGDVRAQAHPGTLATAAHRRRRPGGPPGAACRRRLDPHEPHPRADPGGGPPHRPAAGGGGAGRRGRRSPWAAGAPRLRRSEALCRRRGGPGPGQAVPAADRRPSMASDASPTRSCPTSMTTRWPKRPPSPHRRQGTGPPRGGVDPGGVAWEARQPTTPPVPSEAVAGVAE